MPKERVKHGKLTATWTAKPEDPPMSDVSLNPVPDGVEEVAYAILSKEYAPNAVPDPDIPKNATITEDPSMDISWNRVGWVQASISMPAAKWREIAEELDKSKGLAQAIYTDVLTRKEINDMIKVLRKARDQAYGVDE